MIRKLAIALSLLGACFAGFVHALGLGEVTVKSALNQPLNAEIELVNTVGLTINEILPGLATREEFQNANVDRVYFLSDLRFEVITGSQGKEIIVLTSKKPVREPFLNFIVELIWPSGRLLREYSLLIDPPLFSNQPVVKSRPSSSTVGENISGDVLNISNDSSESSASRSLLSPTAKIETGTYGATNSTDTLWDIALKARPNRSVSPQQVMLAIQDLNPSAFIDDNINKLKAGRVLRLPSLEQMEQRSQHQAIIGVIAQNEALSGKRSASVVQGSKKDDASVLDSKQGAVQAKSAISGDQLKLVVPSNDVTATTDSANSGQSNQAGSGSANDLTLTLEKLDKASIENKELNGRVIDLEEQLSTLQRLLTLKNDQLSSIQNQMRVNELEKVKTQLDSEESVNQIAASNEQTDDIADSVGGQISEQTASTDIPKGNDATDVADEPDNDRMVEGSVINEAERLKVDTAIAEKPVNGQPKSENLIVTIINNPLYLAIALLSVLVLVVMLWLVSKYNVKREEEFLLQNAYTSNDEVSFDSDADLNLGSDDEYENQINNLDNDGFQERDVFDYSEDSDDNTSEGESEDILAEVNAYISYGRLDQATSVLEKAISNEPVRTDYRLKLLTIYKDLGDRQAFDRQFSELEAIQDLSAIQEAENIREDIIEDASLSFDTNNDFDLEANSDNLKKDSTLGAHEVSDLDEELKAFDFDSATLDDSAQEEELDLTSELDLEGLDVTDQELLDQESLSIVPDESLEIEDILALDSADLDSMGIDLSESVDGLSSEDFDDSILDIDLEDLDLNAELDQESEIALSGNIEDPKLDALVEGVDGLVVSDDILEEAAQAFEEDSVALDEDLSDADDFDFLNGTDEASTKLDLARAYIDMGDVEGAKDILLEVTKEGSDAQQTEAKELLDSID
ncbi:MAG: pilus assembly protein FimV [Oleiphilaceae bacterium]|jgi:pilus assembly protein FimV